MAVSDNHRTEAPTRRGVHERLGALPPAGEPVPFDPRRTLPLRIEFIRQLKRRRTQLVALVLLLLPILVAIAFKVGGQQTSGGAALVDIATTGATNFALFTEFAAIGFLLVVIVALFCGDTGRERSELVFPPLPARGAGAAFPPPAAEARRIADAQLWCQPAVAAVGVRRGRAVLRLGARPFTAGRHVHHVRSRHSARHRRRLRVCPVPGRRRLGFPARSHDGRPARCGRRRGAARRGVQHPRLDLGVGSVPAILPTHYQYSWLDALGPTVVWDDMLRGIGLSLVYAAVFLGAAWVRFQRKDITS
jgi:ABC-2 type transport system permease protein